MSSINDLLRDDLQGAFAAREHGYWRSLEDLDVGTTRLPDGLDRREFMRLMGASLALAAASGCVRDPPEKIVPYVKSPNGIVPGEPLYFATAIPRGGYALGVLAESHEGRPTKLEGNSQHPASQGATDALTQAAVLELYDPDRSQTVLQNGIIQTWDRFLTSLTRELEALQPKQGAGLRILTETITSPTLAAQLDDVLKKLPEAQWHQYEPAGLDNIREGTRLAFGRYVEPVYHFERADVVLSLDADFLAAFPGSVRYARDFIDRRRVSSGSAEGREQRAENREQRAESSGKPGSMNRLYVVESTPTITGAMADHRQPVRPSLIEGLARQIAARLGVELPGTTESTAVPAEFLNTVIDDLQSKKRSSLVIAGPGQPPIVHALVHAINNALGNIGQTVELLQPVVAQPQDQLASLQKLVTDMAAGRVDILIMLGGNPVYSAPGKLEFADALSKVRLRVHLSEFVDETSSLCDWHIPAAHSLESWSDARAFDGTVTILQPLISPLYGGKTAHEIAAVLQSVRGKSAYELVQNHWRQEWNSSDFEQRWRRAVHDGIVPDSRLPAAEVSLSLPELRPQVSTTGSNAAIEIEFRADPSVWDGRHANNAWLQELPKPLTKLTWDNAAQVSTLTAQKLGIRTGDVVRLEIDGQTIRAPVLVSPGQADGCVSLTYGYGRTRAGRVGTGVGYDAYAIRPVQAAWFASGTLTKTSDRHSLVTTQQHHDMAGRDIVRVTTLQKLTDKPQESHEEHELLPMYPEHQYTGNAWGMVIDQTACIGCNACVVACQAENNVPVVGKDQVARGREMHWLRVDRYYHGEPANPETYFQPMMCVHCEVAPCEVVCPVAATVHDSEGTSNMVYNRCVGTRYCSNNCPYKVRRFNFLQYSDETTPSLKLLRNPDVTVRSRGVMEKCSYCIQRIDLARIAAKKEGRLVQDGEVMTACQQACPTNAIVFGNLNVSPSKVRELKESPLNYGVLAELNTRPRTTYLTRVANPHPNLPAPQAAQRQEGDHA